MSIDERVAIIMDHFALFRNGKETVEAVAMQLSHAYADGGLVEKERMRQFLDDLTGGRGVVATQR